LPAFTLPEFLSDQLKEMRGRFVRDNNVDQALKALKKKMQREGIFRDEAPRALRKPSEEGP
jgi:ribosomal protein S21